MYRIENIETAGSALKARREAQHLTQAALAAAAGLTRARLSLIESGKTNPSLASYLRLAEALGMQLVMEPVSERPTLAQIQRANEQSSASVDAPE